MASQIVLHTAGAAPFGQVSWQLDGPDATAVAGTYSGAANTLTFSSLGISVADGGSETYTVSAYYSDNTGLTEGAVFQLSVDGDVDLTLASGTQMSGANGAIANGTGSVVEVTATQLVVVTQPAPLTAVSGSALDFTTDPAIEARDAAGNVDTDFADTITLLEAGAGTATYANNAAPAVAGVAALTNLAVTYIATSDGEGFALQADDTPGGAEGDLPTVTLSALNADVVATHLVFSTQPPASATGSADFAGSVAVEARDANNLLDTGFNEAVTLAAMLASDNNTAATGTLASTDAGGLIHTAVSGAVSWTDLSYNPAENIDLRATSASFATGSGNEAYSNAVAVGAPDTDGGLSAAAGVVEPVPLPSAAAAAGSAVDVFDFALSDGGSADGASMDVSEVVLHTSGAAPFAQITWRLDGPDAANVTGTYSGAANTITFGGLSISVADGSSETYTVNAYYSDTSALTEGPVFQLSVDGDADVTVGGTQMSGVNNAVTNGSGSAVEVIATQLVAVTQPAPLALVSGTLLDFSTDPAFEARDASGNLDSDFADVVTVTVSGAGSGAYTNNTVTAVAGVASFPGLTVTYSATSDGEAFALQADDTPAGAEGDLSPGASADLSADVIATQLVFTTQPAGSVNGQPLSTQPVVEAQDAVGILDTDFTDLVSLNEGSPGALANKSVTAVAGVASFTALTYTATTDGEAFALQAYDTPGGAEGFLTPVISSGLTSDVLAIHLVFSIQPAVTVTTGVDFAGSVAAQALDADGLLDTDFSEGVTLAAVLASDNNTAGSGTLASADAGGLTQTAAFGLASWSDLTYDVPETIDLRATSSSFATGSGDEAYSSATVVNGPDTDGSLNAATGVSEPVALTTAVTDAADAVDMFDFALAACGESR